MNRYYYKYIYLFIASISLNIVLLTANSQKCSICIHDLDNEFSIDAWGNAFHPFHEKDGIFCNSCSRIISQTLTKGGYEYSDGRYLCSLCKITSINDDSSIDVYFVL